MVKKDHIAKQWFSKRFSMVLTFTLLLYKTHAVLLCIFWLLQKKTLSKFCFLIKVFMLSVGYALQITHTHTHKKKSFMNFQVCKKQIDFFLKCTFFFFFFWDKVNFLHSILRGAIFWFCTENSVENGGMFQLLLRSGNAVSSPFLLLT